MAEYLKLAAGVLISLVIIVLSILYLRKEKKTGKEPKKKKPRILNKKKIVKTATKRLEQNPKDPDALLALADIYYQEEDYKKAYKNYSVLIDLCASYPELNEFEITLHCGMAAVKIGDIQDAYKYLIIAKNMEPNNFDVNFNLGYIEYQNKNYEKAAVLLQLANKQQPEHVQTIRFLGQSLYKTKKYGDAVNALKSSIEYEPEDKESFFSLAQCYFKLNNNDNALKIFTHLRADPQLGPHASLFAGTIHMNTHAYPKAIMDFELGLRHPKIEPSIEIELRYRLSTAYVKQGEIDRALTLLKRVYELDPNYKDVSELIGSFQELSNNKNLKVFLIAPISEFVSLCRKIAASYYENSHTKLLDISIIKNEYIDILCEVSTKKWEDLVLFRFIRSTGTVGELVTRELYSRCRELRAGRGYCLCAGSYSDGAKKFVEARLIDLIGKKELVKIFERLNRPAFPAKE